MSPVPESFPSRACDSSPVLILHTSQTTREHIRTQRGAGPNDPFLRSQPSTPTPTTTEGTRSRGSGPVGQGPWGKGIQVHLDTGKGSLGRPPPHLLSLGMRRESGHASAFWSVRSCWSGLSCPALGLALLPVYNATLSTLCFVVFVSCDLSLAFADGN